MPPYGQQYNVKPGTGIGSEGRNQAAERQIFLGQETQSMTFLEPNYNGRNVMQQQHFPLSMQQPLSQMNYQPQQQPLSLQNRGNVPLSQQNGPRGLSLSEQRRLDELQSKSYLSLSDRAEMQKLLDKSRT